MLYARRSTVYFQAFRPHYSVTKTQLENALSLHPKKPEETKQ